MESFNVAGHNKSKLQVIYKTNLAKLHTLNAMQQARSRDVNVLRQQLQLFMTHKLLLTSYSEATTAERDARLTHTFLELSTFVDIGDANLLQSSPPVSVPANGDSRTSSQTIDACDVTAHGVKRAADDDAMDDDFTSSAKRVKRRADDNNNTDGSLFDEILAEQRRVNTDDDVDEQLSIDATFDFVLPDDPIVQPLGRDESDKDQLLGFDALIGDDESPSRHSDVIENSNFANFPCLEAEIMS